MLLKAVAVSSCPFTEWEDISLTIEALTSDETTKPHVARGSSPTIEQRSLASIKPGPSPLEVRFKGAKASIEPHSASQVSNNLSIEYQKQRCLRARSALIIGNDGNGTWCNSHSEGLAATD